MLHLWGKHRNLIHCAQLVKYLPYGNNFNEAPKSLCTICMGTEFENSKNCDHSSNRYWRMSYCDKGNRCYVLCKIGPYQVPALEYFNKNHQPEIGFRNFTTMKHEFGQKHIQHVLKLFLYLYVKQSSISLKLMMN